MNTHTALLDLMRGLPEYRQLVAEAQRDGPRVVSLYGVSHIHKAHIAATLLTDLGRPVCVITRDEQSARRMALDIEGFCGHKAAFLPVRDFIFHNLDTRLVTDNIFFVFNLPRATNIQTHRCIEFQRISPRCCFRITEHHSNLHTNLVNKD